MVRLIDPIIADLQMEHAEAAACGQRWKSVRIRIVACAALLRALALLGTAQGDWTRALRLSSACMLLMSLVFMMANLSAVSSWTRASQETLLVLLIPAALGMSFPMGFAVTLLYGLARGAASRAVVVAVLTSAMVSSSGSMVALGWIVPASNRPYD